MRVLSYRVMRRSAAWAAAFAAWSCGNTSEVVNDVASVVVTPSPITLQIGQNQPLQAAVTDAAGRPMSGFTVNWSVRDSRIVFVSAGGMVTGVAVGTTEVAANVNGKSGIASITVLRPPVATVVVLPNRVDAFVGARSTFSAVAYDQNGNTLTGRTFLWSSSNSSVATVGPTGIATAVDAGTATITATSEGKSNTATISVTLTPVAAVTLSPAVISMAPGQTTLVTATARDGAGNIITGRSVQWSSSSPLVATVSANGTVTGVADGTATITANVGGVASTANVVISSASVGSVTIQPSSVTMIQNGTQQLTATVQDVNNVILPRPVTWTTSNAGIATVSAANGLVTGVTPGTATISATREGVSGTITVTVLPATIAAVTVQPSISSIRAGNTVALTATPRDAAGVAIVGRAITWRSSSATIATVSAAGSVTGVAAGRATITATSENVNGTATVDVGAPVETMTVTPGTATVKVGLTLTLVPIVRDANGTLISDRPITWTSSSPAVATVSSGGVVIGVTAGTTTITATCEGKTATATITVVVPPVATVTVQPATVTLSAGATTTLSTVNRDDEGNIVIGRLVRWSVDDESIATVTSAGVVTGVSPGTTTVTANSEGMLGTALVTVLVPVANVTVQPATATVSIGATTTLTASARDGNGNVLTGRIVTWSSNNPGIASVNSAGVVTGVNRGSAIITATSEGRSGTATVTVP